MDFEQYLYSSFGNNCSWFVCEVYLYHSVKGKLRRFSVSNIRVIAEKCGLSVSTVSKALNGYTDVREDTRRRVLEVAQDSGYLPNSIARSLKLNRTHNLGVLIADDLHSGLTNVYFASVLEAFKAEAESYSYDITFINHNMRIHNREMSYLEHCVYRNFDGVCIACVNFSNPEVIELVNSDLPVVTIDHIFNSRTSVNSAHVEGMSDLVRYIYEMGHRKIAYVHGKKSSVTQLRLASFGRTLKTLGIDTPSQYLKEAAYRDMESTKQQVRELLSLPIPPTCIVMPDDYAALGGAEAIREAGMSIPNDVSIAGYDGTVLAQIHSPALTTVRQDSKGIGREAAKRLIEHIENPLTTIPESVVIKGTLIEGQTVSKLESC